MNSDIQLLDCTLRDGGYYTNWDFDQDLVMSYVHSMAKLPIDIVELGYIGVKSDDYKGRFYYTQIHDLIWVRSILRSDQKIAVMVDAKHYSAESLRGQIKDYAAHIDVLRIATDYKQLDQTLSLAHMANSCGVDVALNLMYAHKYAKNKNEIIEIANKCSAHCSIINIVDSYGACYPDQIEEVVGLFCDHVSCKIGFHGHDNIRLAFANALSAVRAGAQLIDACVLGMGRGAGNLQIETWLSYLDSSGCADVSFSDLSNLLEQFGVLKQQYNWGSHLPYQVAGFNELPQADVMHGLGTRRYNAANIIEALKQHAGAPVDNNALPELKPLSDTRDILIIGGGKSVINHEQALQAYIQQRNPLLIFAGVRYVQRLCDYAKESFVCLAGHEIQKLVTDDMSAMSESIDAWLVAPPPRFLNAVPQSSAKVFQVPSLQNDLPLIGKIPDWDPLLLSLAAAGALGSSVVYLCGFDGYEERTAANEEITRQTQLAINRYAQSMKLCSLTPTLYDLPIQSIYELMKS